MGNGVEYQDVLNEMLKNPEIKAEYDVYVMEHLVSRKLTDARKGRDLTLDELSKISGVNRSDIKRIENGNGNPSVRTIKKLADALDCDITLDIKPRVPQKA